MRSLKLHCSRYLTALFLITALGLLTGLACNGSSPTPITPPQASPTPGNSQDRGPASKSGVFDDRVVFGQSAAFSGPAQELGLNMQLGILSAFHEINQAGGVNGRQLELEFADDAYEPEAAIANTLQLINENGVFALIGAVGTPTSRSATPVAEDAGVPYMTPFTGAEFLRDPNWEYVMNLRSSYYQETEEMVARLTEDLGVTRIAVMYQDDSFGRAGYNGVLLALERRLMEPVSIGLYTRNTTAVKAGLLDLQQGDPEAIIVIGAYEPVAALIAWARLIDMNSIFMTVSFVGSNALAEDLASKGVDVSAGVYVTQVVPFPWDASLPVTVAYLTALEAYSPGADPGFVSFEGYLAGRLAIEGLKGCGQDVTKACFLDSLRSRDVIDIDGFELRYGEGDNQGSDSVFLTRVGDDYGYHPVENLQEVLP